MFMILNAAVLSFWITSLVAFGRSYRRNLKRERDLLLEGKTKRITNKN